MNTQDFESSVCRQEAGVIRSALGALDAMYEERQTEVAAEQFAADEIRAAFALRGEVPMSAIAVPSATVTRSAIVRVGSETLASAMLECLAYPEVEEALLEVLEHSSCPLVSALRDAMCERHIRLNAADIAEARA